ncbi:hypothetical protein B0J17DRAFT_721814 [Rhizoctonia solani]|nr:hypothetical protein B0J17DRAFT_721814 [Rhizoctonia solani]
MSSFIRYAGAAALVLSLGLIVSALPVMYANIPTPTGDDAVSRLCAKLVIEGELQAKIKALPLCLDIEDAKVKIAAIVALFKGCSDELLRIGAGVAVNVEAKASLVACIVKIITLCAQVCVALSLKFGLSICVEIDMALRSFLSILGICVNDIVELIVKALASATVGLLTEANLKLCLNALNLN